MLLIINTVKSLSENPSSAQLNHNINVEIESWLRKCAKSQSFDTLDLHFEELASNKNTIEQLLPTSVQEFLVRNPSFLTVKQLLTREHSFDTTNNYFKS